MSAKTPVLFCRADSVYKTLSDCDVYDIERNALTCESEAPAIHHPPCRAWGKLKGQAKPRKGEKELAIWSVCKIRQNGGVLEHPKGSSLWREMMLPEINQLDGWGGFTIEVNQCWWGHRAEKKTLLYIVGIKPGQLPALPPHPRLAPTHLITQSRGSSLPECSKAEREHTPIEFAKYLLEIARRCENPGNGPVIAPEF